MKHSKAMYIYEVYIDDFHYSCRKSFSCESTPSSLSAALVSVFLAALVAQPTLPRNVMMSLCCCGVELLPFFCEMFCWALTQATVWYNCIRDTSVHSSGPDG